MQWLMTHMWMALAATSVLGLLFGWATRGLRLQGKLRRAEGERNIALGALEEKEGELEAMFSAGRTPSASGGISAGDDELKRVLEEREIKLQSLTDELAHSKAELNELRDPGNGNGGGAMSAAAVGAAVAVVAAGAASGEEAPVLGGELNEDDASLEWRNRYLESRVRTLQTQIHELGSGAPIDGDVSAGAAGLAPIVADTQPGNDVSLAKMKWQNDYLRQRLSYMENHGAPGSSGIENISPPTATAAIIATEADAPSADEPTEDSDETADQELAKLRWRNRYLEGRLAYYEGDKGQTDDGDSGVVGLASTAAVALGGAVGVASLSDTGEAERSTDTVEQPSLDLEQEAAESIATDPAAAGDDVDFGDLDLDPDAEPEIEVNEREPGMVQTEPEEEPSLSEEETEDEAEQATEHDQEELEEEHRGIQPLALEGPVDGEGDDLTAIGGIGPKIEEVLNELGVFHYDQIAAWTPDNVDWIDDHLAFEGRIEREQWVQQAAALSGED